MSTKTQTLDVRLDHLDLLAPVLVEETSPYGEVLERMRTLDRGSVIVTKSGKVTGIFTERDYLYKHCLEDTDLKTPICKLMSTRPIAVSPETTLGEAVEIMHEKKFRNLPIVDASGRPKGLLTVGRVIRYLADHFPAEVVNLPPTLHQVSQDPEGA